MTFEQIIADLGGARGLALAIGVPESHARTMKARKSIPLKYWRALIAAADNAGIRDLDYAALIAMTDQRSKRRAAA